MNIGAARRNTFGRKQIRRFRQGRVNARKYIAEQNRLRGVMSRRLAKKLETAFRKDLGILLHELKLGLQPTFDASVRRKEEEILAAVTAESRKLFRNVVELNDRKYEDVLTKAAVDLGFGFSRPDFVQSMTSYFISSREIQFANISVSMTRRVLSDIDDALAEGTGVAQLSRDIRRKYSNINRNRAALIARTETHSALGFGQHSYHTELRDDLGLNMVKQWVATLDPRTRSAHAQMNGTQVSMDEAFKMPNGTEMQFAGDPAGGAANVINCRCAIVYVDVEDEVVDSKKPPTAFDGSSINIDPKQRFEYEDGLTKLVTPQQLAIQNGMRKPKRIYQDGDEGVYYPDVEYLVANPKDRLGQVLIHEYGHHIDFAINKQRKKMGAWSTSADAAAFQAAYMEDRKNLGLRGAKNRDGILAFRNDLYTPEAATHKGRSYTKWVTKDDYVGNISDIVDAMTGGAFRSKYGHWGHGTTYYRRRTAKFEETFANLYSLRNTPRWSYIQEKFPNLAREFDNIMNEIEEEFVGS